MMDEILTDFQGSQTQRLRGMSCHSRLRPVRRYGISWMIRLRSSSTVPSDDQEPCSPTIQCVVRCTPALWSPSRMSWTARAARRMPKTSR